MRFNCRFTDIMSTTPSGQRLVDFRGFNTVIQNTIMPVSYGLTFEETVAINGPSVASVPPKSRHAAREGAGKAKRGKSKASVGETLVTEPLLQKRGEKGEGEGEGSRKNDEMLVRSIVRFEAVTGMGGCALSACERLCTHVCVPLVIMCRSPLLFSVSKCPVVCSPLLSLLRTKLLG
jgi:hypothetical protein